MSLIRWDPFADVEAMFNRMTPRWTRLSAERNGDRNLQWAPSADISETEKEYVIRAELPAVKKEDVHVTIEDGVITIKGERKQQKEEKNEKIHRVETLYGSFERSFSLPDNVNADTVKCESKDGVLTVRLPKSDVQKPTVKRISVQ